MEIEKNVPMPEERKRNIRSRGVNGGYGWRKMDIGDSVFFGNQPKGTESPPSVSARVYGFRYGMKFTARKINGGVRIWRVK